MRYKKLKDGSLKVRADCEAQVNLFNFLACVYEVGLYPLWVPFCTKATEFHSMGDFGKAVIVDFNIGKILFSREICMAGFGWDRLYHAGCVFIECKSLHKVGPTQPGLPRSATLQPAAPQEGQYKGRCQVPLLRAASQTRH